MRQHKNAQAWDVVIVGAGLIGLSCALALAKQDFRVLILEAKKNPEVTLPKPEDPIDARVVAISRATEQFFHQIGIWSSIQESRQSPYLHMKVWDSVADGEIHFSAWDFFEPNLGHIVEQRVILGALWQSLGQYPQVTLRDGTTLHHLKEEISHIELRTESDLIKTSLVIGADGANSLIRKMGQFIVRGWEYEQSAIIATIAGDKPHQSTAFQRFAADGSLALLPLSHPYQTSIVWATTPTQANTLCQQTAVEFNQVLTRESQSVLGQLNVIGARFQIPLRTHHAKSYVMPRCALVGDAAHTLHPLAGQGVNLGFLDVVSLVEVLVKAKSKKRDIGALHILQRYERNRKMHNQIMIWSMELFKRSFTSKSNLLMFLRNKGLNWVDNNINIKHLFAKLAMGTKRPELL